MILALIQLLHNQIVIKVKKLHIFTQKRHLKNNLIVKIIHFRGVKHCNIFVVFIIG